MEKIKLPKAMKIILVLLILLIIIIGLFIFFKNNNNNKSILTKIGDAAVNIRESKNFYYEVNSNHEDVGDYKIWVDGNKIAFQISDSTENYINYVDLDKGETYIVNEDNKTYTKTENIPAIAQNGGAFVNPPAVFSIAMNSSLNGEDEEFKNMLDSIEISEEEYKGVACYKITDKENEIEEITYFNKDSLLPIETIIGEEKREYTINKNSVEENDVTFSDIDLYEENK